MVDWGKFDDGAVFYPWSLGVLFYLQHNKKRRDPRVKKVTLKLWWVKKPPFTWIVQNQSHSYRQQWTLRTMMNRHCKSMMNRKTDLSFTLSLGWPGGCVTVLGVTGWMCHRVGGVRVDVSRDITRNMWLCGKFNSQPHVCHTWGKCEVGFFFY